jgi:hypothetical protein
MIDSERFKLLYGPYLPPKCRIGDTLPCEYRGREVKVRRITDAPIQWPAAFGGSRASPILCGDLIRAVKRESEIAVAHHWGVSHVLVWRWRRALEVPAINHGSRRLRIEYAAETLTPDVRAEARAAMDKPVVRAKLSAAKAGKPLHANAIAAMREANKRPKSDEWKRKRGERSREMWKHPEKYGLPAHREWTAEQDALIGTDTDSAIARALNLPYSAIAYRRHSLGIARPSRRWTANQMALLGTAADQEVGRRVGKSATAVAKKRLERGIPAFEEAPWTPEEIALLGTASDAAIGRRLGKEAPGVYSRRSALGIPLFTPRWTKAEDALLGTDSDPAIAKVLGRTEIAVGMRRRKLRIEAYR